MPHLRKKLTRRKFIDIAALSAKGLCAYPVVKGAAAGDVRALTDKVPVVVAKHDNVINSMVIDQGVVQIMLDSAIRSLTGIVDVGGAWRSLFPGITQESTISIKINCINSQLSSHPETAYSIVNGLTAMDVEGLPFPEKNIIIWDRTNNEMKRAGYSINTSDTGVKCFGTNQSGAGYTSSSYDVAGSSQRLSTIVTEMSDYMINLCVLKNHGDAGVTFSMKNHYGSCNKPGNLHGGYCNPYIAALNSLAPIREKQVLNICDALFGIISGGPGGSPQIQPNIIVMSRDRVANDNVCGQILADNGCNTMYRARHLSTAAGSPYSLGTNDPDMIDTILIENPVVSVDEDTLDRAIPQAFRTYQNYPNPFNAQTTLSYQLFEPARVQLFIYNAQGALVRRLIDERQSSGYYRAAWNGTASRGQPVSSGIYFGRFSVDNERSTVRMNFVK